MPSKERTGHTTERVWAITGLPGAGKTTLARWLAEEYDRRLISSHDIADRIDPAAISEGRMADAGAMSAAFTEALIEYEGDKVVIDGWPRSPDQALLLPHGSIVFLLDCALQTARERLAHRGRADDTPILVRLRIDEQVALLGVSAKGGWARELATWERCLSTDHRSIAQVRNNVCDYIDGRKAQVF